MLACGGIENARLLLASQCGYGIGNENDLVGRFFMEHPGGTTGFFVSSEPAIETLMAPFLLHQGTQGVWSRWRLALTKKLLRDEMLQRYSVNFWPTEPEWMPDDLTELAQRQLAYYQGSQTPRLYAISFMSEQAPNPDSRITLSDQVDENGIKLPCLDWQLSEVDIRTLIRGQQIIQEEFQLAGVGPVYTRRYSDAHGGFLTPLWGGYEACLGTSHHHMGTTRMHNDPQQGVVNSDCQVHSVENLFIAGSSVFPTGGFANPTLTIVALAVKLADHIHDQLTKAQ